IPYLSGATKMPTVNFPTVPGLYWAQIPSPGPQPPNAPPAYNAIAILSGNSPFMRLAVLPLSGIQQPGRVWQPGDVLAIGGPVEIPPIEQPNSREATPSQGKVRDSRTFAA